MSSHQHICDSVRGSSGASVLFFLWFACEVNNFEDGSLTVLARVGGLRWGLWWFGCQVTKEPSMQFLLCCGVLRGRVSVSLLQR